MFGINNIKKIQNETYNLFIFGMIVYLPVIFSLKELVSRLNKERRKSLCDTLQIPFAIWCTGLSIFSGLGTYYLGKHLLTEEIDCSIIDGDTGYWTTLFILSKLPELLDTVFIVLRSKPLVVIQYYHHLATLIIAYMGLYKFYPETIICAFMNYFVHTFMYAYYAIYSFGFKNIRKYGIYITIIQTLQMVLAIIFCSKQLIDNKPCINDYPYMDKITTYLGLFIYVTYIYLFGQLLMKKSKEE